MAEERINIDLRMRVHKITYYIGEVRGVFKDEDDLIAITLKEQFINCQNGKNKYLCTLIINRDEFPKNKHLCQ
ncbi:hypothetical protein RCH13_001035 [Chryseobacterium sp. MP_3.2]|nr:hypothetical protein [Chryseobacterium sp. MP_3.2]